MMISPALKHLLVGLSIGCALGISDRAAAEADEDSPITIEPTSDRSNYLSDRLKFSFPRRMTRLLISEANPGDDIESDIVCVPAFSTLEGIGNANVNKKVSIVFRVTYVAPVKTTPDPISRMLGGVPTPTDSDTCPDKNWVRIGDIVTLPLNQIESIPPERYGLTYGALMVPFKYQLRGDRGALGGNAAVGGYLGFRQDRSGITGLALQYVVFLGASSVPVTQIVDGAATTQNLAGLSYGIGILGRVKGDFQFGLVVGADQVSKSADYINRGKPWVALSLGFSFSN